MITHTACYINFSQIKKNESNLRLKPVAQSVGNLSNSEEAEALCT